MNEYFKIGKLVATFGLTGELILKHSLGKKSMLKGVESLFVEDKKDSFIPYFIESAKIKNDTEIYLKLEGFKTKEKAQTLVSNEVWMHEKDFKKQVNSGAPISLLGFTLINEEVDLGEIVEVIEQPHQILCKIIYNKNEALIPINDEFLNKIDKKSKKVYVDLPDGLLEIYK